MRVRCAVWFSLTLGLTASFAAQNFPEGFFSPQRVKTGEELSRSVCASCHFWPAPDLLDRETWFNGPLPWMMMLMGLSPEALPSGLEGTLIRRSGVILDPPPVKQADFGSIIAFYLQSAPATLALTNRPTVAADFSRFRPHAWPLGFSEPMVTLLKIKAKTLLLGDGNQGQLQLLSQSGEAIDKVSLGSPPVHALDLDHEVLVTCIGSFSPSEQAKGSLMRVPLQGNRFGAPQQVLGNLRRPVKMTATGISR